MLLLDENQNVKAESINNIAEKLTSLDWYSSVGQKSEEAERAVSSLLDSLQVDQYELEWVNVNDLAETLDKIRLDGSAVWEKLKDVPDQLKEKIDQLNEVKLLEEVVDIIPEVVFHRAFECAYETFKEEKLVQFFVGQAMYFAVLICAAEIANETELAESFLNVLETGHVPVGPNEKSVYMI